MGVESVRPDLWQLSRHTNMSEQERVTGWHWDRTTIKHDVIRMHNECESGGCVAVTGGVSPRCRQCEELQQFSNNVCRMNTTVDLSHAVDQFSGIGWSRPERRVAGAWRIEHTTECGLRTRPRSCARITTHRDTPTDALCLCTSVHRSGEQPVTARLNTGIPRLHREATEYQLCIPLSGRLCRMRHGCSNQVVPRGVYIARGAAPDRPSGVTAHDWYGVTNIAGRMSTHNLLHCIRCRGAPATHQSCISQHLWLCESPDERWSIRHELQAIKVPIEAHQG